MIPEGQTCQWQMFERQKCPKEAVSERPVCAHPKKNLALSIYHTIAGVSQLKERHMVCDLCGIYVTCIGEPTYGEWGEA